MMVGSRAYPGMVVPVSLQTVEPITLWTFTYFIDDIEVSAYKKLGWTYETAMDAKKEMRAYVNRMNRNPDIYLNAGDTNG